MTPIDKFKPSDVTLAGFSCTSAILVARFMREIRENKITKLRLATNVFKCKLNFTTPSEDALRGLYITISISYHVCHADLNYFLKEIFFFCQFYFERASLT
ncbi:uncharacterized protein TM35_000242120 [Trypanosoma theileri]|uniref:Uncharacterized protein n=1 Tax=Trypanosoma theileri TaxID=67003 RepID=A0A1X0NQR9_9TRYP|nr:uncharacterized protein TM35_000242120 [Trypanosoma theileri]ORC87062.1 hypothetical protein TM35_000242120 [Trypanosoma theileri]